ncbi:hypothetical protein ACFVHA_28560 [Bacillus cereus]|uniref:hypothetical protein n=1 Tax=Bacillus cereus TaxID=1396 RepID=UPI00363EFC1D
MSRLFDGLEHHRKLPPGDPRGVLAFEDYPPALQRRMDARHFADWEHRVTLRDATEIERDFLAHLGYIDATENRPINAHITWRRGVRELVFKYHNGKEIR